MPRHSRKKSSTQTYHVVIKGADRQLLFEEQQDFEKYLEIIEYYKEQCQFDLYAYCLMSNHVHLLIHHTSDFSLETIFRRINTSYAGWFNMKYNRTGFVQDGRYFSEPVESERDLLTVVKYIHFNPTKAGMEEAPGASYPWSSFYDYRDQFNGLTDISLVLDIVGGTEHFQVLHTIGSDDKCMDIDQFRKRLPDDVAKDIIYQISKCSSSTEFQKLSLEARNQYIALIHEKGVSIRQLNRLSGIPRGVIERVLAKHRTI
ncbi:MAG: transposase [Eubacterium sp.]|nr:transposase [Eubacterium sp.]